MNNYLRLVRFNEWSSVFLIIITGALLSKSFNIYLFILFAAVIAASYSYTFIINEYFDADYDKKNNRNTISNGCVEKNSAVLLSLILLSAGFASVYLFMPNITIIYVFAIFLATTYSAPPFRFKEKFPLDSAIHGAGPALAFLMSYMLFYRVDVFSIVLSIAIFIINVSAGIVQEIRDYSADRKSGFNTTVSVLGVKRSIEAIKLMFLALIAVFVYVVYSFLPAYYIIFALIFVPFIRVLFGPYKGPVSFVKKSYKAGRTSSFIFIFLIIMIFIAEGLLSGYLL